MDQLLMQVLSNGITHQKPASADPWGQSWVETLPCKSPTADSMISKTTGYSPPHLSDNPQNWFHELQEVAPGERKASCGTAYKPPTSLNTHTLSPYTCTPFPLRGE